MDLLQFYDYFRHFFSSRKDDFWGAGGERLVDNRCGQNLSSVSEMREGSARNNE